MTLSVIANALAGPASAGHYLAAGDFRRIGPLPVERRKRKAGDQALAFEDWNGEMPESLGQ
jgi:hypothetical protein